MSPVAGILILFTLALTWLAVIPGLTAKSPDGASAFAYPLIFLPFISSAFVPTDTMPGPVRAFAEHQPVTSIVNAIRDLFTQQPVGTDIWIALAAVGPGKAVPGGAVPPGLDAEAAGTVARLILGGGDQEPARPVDKALTTDHPTPRSREEVEREAPGSGGGASGGIRTPTGCPTGT
jgi:hypothetical protein